MSQQERARKRAEAEARQARYDALTPAQKLEQIAERRGSSSKELKRVMPQHVAATLENKGTRTVDGVEGTVYGPEGVEFPWR